MLLCCLKFGIFELDFYHNIFSDYREYLQKLV